jgi:hypothetical protein
MPEPVGSARDRRGVGGVGSATGTIELEIGGITVHVECDPLR